MLAGVTDCRRSQKWAAKEDGCWDLNLGPAAIERRRPCGSEGRSRPHGSEVNRRNHEVQRGKEEGQDQAALVK